MKCNSNRNVNPHLVTFGSPSNTRSVLFSTSTGSGSSWNKTPVQAGTDGLPTKPCDTPHIPTNRRPPERALEKPGHLWHFEMDRLSAGSTSERPALMGERGLGVRLQYSYSPPLKSSAISDVFSLQKPLKMLLAVDASISCL